MIEQLIHILPNHELYFMNVGEDPPAPRPNWDMVKRRRWPACVKYNFLSAGQGKVYSVPTLKLIPEDIVAAYITDVGYVGIGEVRNSSIPIIDFRYKAELLKGLPGISKYLFDNSDRNNPKSEHVIEMDWIRIRDRNNSLWIPQDDYGYYASRDTVTKIDRKKHSDTIEVLERFFKVLFIYH